MHCTGSIFKMASKIIVLELESGYFSIGFSGEPSPRFIGSSEVFNNDVEGATADFFRLLFLDTLFVKAKDLSVLIVADLFVKQSILDNLASILLKEFQVIYGNCFFFETAHSWRHHRLYRWTFSSTHTWHRFPVESVLVW